MSNDLNERDEATDEQPKAAPKIIVDSDWKEQVAKEKQAAQSQAASPPSDTQPADRQPSDTEPTTTDKAAVSSGAKAEKKPTKTNASPSLPEPTFEVLVSMLFTQAVSALGQMPSPVDGETRVNKPMAKHTIEMLDMLLEKTKGNLTETESKMLGEALHLLRMAYVNARA